MLKQMLYAGIGLAAVTKEKAEEVIGELIKKGEMSKEEGKDVLNTLKDRIQEESERLKQKINEQVEHTITSMNLVRKSQLDEVLQRLNELEKKLNEIQSKKEA
jgi:polyhydroxyalkanoate synthesis regulator phasin